MTEQQFLSLTPGQFQILSKRWIEAETVKRKERDYHTAKICWAIWEPQRDKTKRPQPFTIDDFMPQLKKKVNKEQSPQEQTVVLMQLFGGAKK